MSLSLNEFDEVHTNLLHAKAMLAVIHGEGADSFMRYDDLTQGNYIWACHDAVARAVEIMEKSDGIAPAKP